MPIIAQSSRNPFRNQGSQAQSSTTNEPSTSFVSPTPTGNSASSTPASSTTPNDHLINDLPSSSSTSTALSTDGLDEELPPAYTLAPDSSHGEQTVEYGPRRPFQNPPPRPVPPQHSIPAQSTGWSTIQSHVIHPSPPPSQPQSLWQQITGHLADQLTGLSSDSYSSRYGTYPTTHNTGYSSSFPPPSQSTWTSQTAPNSIEPPPLPPRRDTSQISPTSEFARDFYAAGAGPPPDHNETTRYPPPPGPPPGSPPSGSPRTSDDDGRPTKTPVPGHPLLNHGRLLVYPPGFECDKCHNVGYKQNDPSNPCRKCWSKYAKPFSGAITYSSFKSSSAGTGKTFQRPLPLLRPPQAGIARQQHSHGYPGSAYVQNRGQEQNSYTTRPPPGSYAPHSQPPQQPPPNIQVAPGGYSPYGPPPGSVVYAPGDPRLGGRLCWRCDGDGTIGAFLFQEQCSVCGGLGRTYN
ncbi:hypothetical protein DFJ43DRAFT_280380 [Lentinula guzmanii]|uniref:Uncharacterized protein n=1 Tax=Lentinula guzmanii TaxID=2804957 RepID=A0AA38JTV6_9AGAR|nr:hypothetical protein DFJ43DRAFT_280380 [Lentinula guzmanii]